MRFLILSALLAGICATPALAETRNFTITGFDRIRVAGPFTVNLRTGPGPSARAVGTMRGLDRLKVEVQGRTLIISTDRSAWGGWAGEDQGKVTVSVTTPSLVAATLIGSGDLNVDRAQASRFDLAVTGSGDARIGAIQADRLLVTVTGSGQAMIAGKVAQTRAVVQGAGSILGEKLTTADLDLNVMGSGDVALAATRSAKVVASGSGSVVVAGSAACTVRSMGSSEVRCGRGGRI